MFAHHLYHFDLSRSLYLVRSKAKLTGSNSLLGYAPPNSCFRIEVIFASVFLQNNLMHVVTEPIIYLNCYMIFVLVCQTELKAEFLFSLFEKIIVLCPTKNTDHNQLSALIKLK